MLARLRHVASGAGARVAVADGQRTLTFGELTRRVEELAQRLPPRTVVACVLSSGPDFTALHLACVASQSVFFPLPVGATASEHQKAFGLVLPDVVVAEPAQRESVQSALAALDHACLMLTPEDLSAQRGAMKPTSERVLPDDVVMVQLTSGSTGVPKALVLSATAIEAGIDAGTGLLSRFEGAAVFSVMPQFHAMGGAVVLEHLLHGSSVHVSNRFVPGDDRHRMHEHAVEALIGSPSYFRIVHNLKMFAGDALPTLRAAVLGSAHAEPSLLESLREAAPQMSLHLRYGLSEAFGALTRLDILPEEPLPPRGLVGPALAGFELDASVDPDTPGEVRARAATLATAWLQAGGLSPLADPQGWLHTGDTGFVDARGLHLRGRKSQFIKRQGYRIDPGEIEQAMLAVDGVSEAVVLDSPDPVAGATIIGVYEGSATPQEIQVSCRQQLAPYKIPQRFVSIAPIPRTHSGKPDRVALREHLHRAKANPSS